METLEDAYEQPDIDLAIEDVEAEQGSPIVNFLSACKHAGGTVLRIVLTTDPREIASNLRQF